MKSIMHNFAVNPDVKIPRSMFKMPFTHKTTFDAGWLIPVFWMPVLPGDTITCNPTLFARMSTPAFPIMDNLFLDVQHFFFPTRIIFDNYRKFHGEQDDPGDSISFTIPQLTGTTNSDADGDLTTTAGRTSALLNYLGVPEGIDATDVEINAELFRGYNQIYKHWFRDQNLIDSPVINTDDGPDTDTDYLLQRRGKRFDYFTQALPSPQRGSAVSLPLGTSAPLSGTIPVIGDNTQMQLAQNSDSGSLVTISSEATTGNLDTSLSGASQGMFIPDGGDFGANVDLSTGTADLSTATAATINDIREAFQVQRLLERDARSGTRLPEILRAHYGVTNFYDASYRPEFLGGGSQAININPVTVTTKSPGTADPGDLAAFGTGLNRGNGFTKSFVEHGFIMSIVSVRADLTYQRGLNRFFSHQTRYDVAYPVLSHLGEQALLSKELYVDGTANDDDVFGYVPRYDEYRYNVSRISGHFLSDAATPLDAWHLSQEFSTRPTLDQTFIEENPPMDRVINTASEPHFIFDSYFDVRAARVLPTYGIPGRIDHF